MNVASVELLMGMVSELRASVQREAEARHSVESQLLSMQREIDSRRAADSQIVELKQALAQEVQARMRTEQESRNLEGKWLELSAVFVLEVSD
jgi:hypothetical protein